ncbi:MAG TPA: hypothetical protein VLZ83_11550 [Edaphocola sp.]|nr:hypothetical protein [Edaphocola sp.]
MKKKIVFAVATGLFALAMVFNMNVLQSNNAGDVSLDAITVMALANGESGGGSVVCYAVISDSFYSGETYRRCNNIVKCSDPFLGKNPKHKSRCTPK